MALYHSGISTCAGTVTIGRKDSTHSLGVVCFNQPLARMLADDLASEPARGNDLVTVSTFHELCLTLGREAGTLPPEPAEKTQEWWDEVLPRALDAALSVVGGRYHAIVVDEGLDFARDWLDSLYLMLTDPEHDVLYVFHDPEQSLYRDDVGRAWGCPRSIGAGV